MPYIAIKFYPKDEETKRRVVERIYQVILEEVGGSPEAAEISYEEIAPEEEKERVVKPEIKPKADKMMIVSGEKKY